MKNRNKADVSVGNGRTRVGKNRAMLMLALAPLAGMFTSSAVAATYTFDPQHTTAGSSGDGLWDTTTNNWALSGADVVWPNDTTSTAAFGVGTAAGNVTVAAPINVSSILFNTTTAGSNYLIGASGGNTLSLVGAGTITVVAGESPTISAPIGGTVGLTLNDGTATGNLTLTGNNTYTGTTTVNSGTLIVGPGGNLGAATNGLVVGQSSTTSATTSPTTTPGNVIFNNSATVGSITSAVNNATASTIAISGTNVLTVNGAMTVGLATAAATAPNVALTVTGNELDLNGSLTVGLADTGNRYLTTLDMSGLTTFVLNSPTGAFNGGAASQANATILLAKNNTITAATMTLSSTTSNAGAVTMTLGNGTNVINVSNITLGAGKGNAAVKFAAANAGTVVINGTGGAGTVANITLSNFTSATPNNSQSNLALATHNAQVNAGTVIIGELAGATGRTANGSITFDTGTFNAQSMQISLDASGGSSSATFGSIGTFVLGTDNNSTGVLNVTNSFILGSLTNSSTNTTFANATFTINGGTANIGTNILLTKAANVTNATANSILNLNGGVLNMMGNSIGTVALPITVKLAPTAGQVATLSNLGGAGINGAGLTANGLGTLILDGTNSYTGTTTVTSGILQVGSGGATGTFGAGDVAVTGGTLVVNKTGSAVLSGNLTGAGNVTLQGGGTTVFAGSANNFTGVTTVNNSTLAGVGTLGALTLNGGLLKPGTSAADGSIGTMAVSTLTVTGGELRFDLSGATSDLINVTGAATFSNSSNISVTIAGTPTTGNYTLVAAGSGITGAGTISLTTTAIGRTHFSLDTTTNANDIFLNVTGAAASLVFNGLNSNVWDTQTSANFLNGATQDQFFTGDAVTFNDSNGGHYAVTINGQVSPGSILVNNSGGDYVFTGADASSGIGGIGTLTKSGTGNLTLASNNTRTGSTVINQGGLILASTGTMASGNISVSSGTSFSVASGGSLTSTPNVVDNGTVSLSNSADTFATLNGSGSLNLTGTALSVSGGGIFTGSIVGTGSLLVTGATLQIGAGSSGSDAVATSVSGGATLAVNLNSPFTGALSGGGGLQILSSGNQAFSGPVTLTGPTALTNGGIQLTGSNTDSLGALSGANGLIVGDGLTATALTLSGISSLTGGVTVNAGSTLTVPLAVQIATTSGVTLNGGTMVFGNNISGNNFGANPITVGPGSSTLRYTGANLAGLGNNINVGANNLTIDINDSNGVTKNGFTYAGVFNGGGNVSIINSGTWAQDTYILNSTSNALSGNLTVGASGAGVRLEVNNGSALGNALVTAFNGSEFWINIAGSYANPVTFAGIGTPVDTPSFGGIRLNNNVTLSGPLTLSGDGLITAGTNGSNQVILSGLISGAHTLTTESGVFTLSNANSYGGVSAGTPGTIVARYNNTQSSTIILGNANALGAGGLQLAGGGVELNGLSISLPNLSSTSTGGAVATTATADTSTAGTAFLQVASLAGIINGDYVSGAGVPTNTYVTGTATQETPKANGTINTNSIVVSSATGLLPGEGITATGIPAGTTITAISGTTLTLSNNLSAALANATVTIASGNVVTLNNTLTANPTTAAVSILDGSVISNNGTGASGTVATVTAGSDNTNQTFGGSLVDGTSGGTLAFAKTGNGVQTMTGASTYSGGTVVNAGTLLVSNTSGSGTGSGSVIVNGGTLGGTGTIAGSVIPGSGPHTLHAGPGGGVAGTLSIGGNMSTNANTTLAFDLGSPDAGAAGSGSLPNGSSDLLKVTGNLALSGGSLAITSQASTGNLSLGYYKVVSYSGSLTGDTSGIVLPAIANNIEYTLDSTRDPGFLDVHRGYIGDATDDGKVDLNDLNVVLNHLGVATNSWNNGNFDGAATIDLNDLNAVLNHLGTSIPDGANVVAFAESLVAGTASPAATPEPATLGIAGFAAVALLLRRKRA